MMPLLLAAAVVVVSCARGGATAAGAWWSPPWKEGEAWFAPHRVERRQCAAAAEASEAPCGPDLDRLLSDRVPVLLEGTAAAAWPALSRWAETSAKRKRSATQPSTVLHGAAAAVEAAVRTSKLPTVYGKLARGSALDDALFGYYHEHRPLTALVGPRSQHLNVTYELVESPRREDVFAAVRRRDTPEQGDWVYYLSGELSELAPGLRADVGFATGTHTVFVPQRQWIPAEFALPGEEVLDAQDLVVDSPVSVHQDGTDGVPTESSESSASVGHGAAATPAPPAKAAFVGEKAKVVSARAQEQQTMLWVGPEGVITHTHNDAYHNCFVQITGRKRFILFPPGAEPDLYVFPAGHPRHQQSAVDLRASRADIEAAFPRFARRIAGHDVSVGPGEVLYIPPGWFHWVYSSQEGPGTSVNIWTQDVAEARFQLLHTDAIKAGCLVDAGEDTAAVVRNARLFAHQLVRRVLDALHDALPPATAVEAEARQNDDKGTGGVEAWLKRHVFDSRFAHLGFALSSRDGGASFCGPTGGAESAHDPPTEAAAVAERCSPLVDELVPRYAALGRQARTEAAAHSALATYLEGVAEWTVSPTYVYAFWRDVAGGACSS